MNTPPQNLLLLHFSFAVLTYFQPFFFFLQVSTTFDLQAIKESNCGVHFKQTNEGALWAACPCRERVFVCVGEA